MVLLMRLVANMPLLGQIYLSLQSRVSATFISFVSDVPRVVFSMAIETTSYFQLPCRKGEIFPRVIRSTQPQLNVR